MSSRTLVRSGSVILKDIIFSRTDLTYFTGSTLSCISSDRSWSMVRTVPCTPRRSIRPPKFIHEIANRCLVLSGFISSTKREASSSDSSSPHRPESRPCGVWALNDHSLRAVDPTLPVGRGCTFRHRPFICSQEKSCPNRRRLSKPRGRHAPSAFNGHHRKRGRHGTVCVANWASPIVIQVVLLLAVFLKVYMSSAFAPIYHEFVTGPTRAASFRTRTPLQYHLTIEDGKIMTSGRTEGAFVLQTTVSSHIVGPPRLTNVSSVAVHIWSLTGRRPSTKRPWSRCTWVAVFEGEPAMISALQMDPQRTGASIRSPLWDRYATVKRPPGSDQVAYVFQRSSQT
jgi:hypothetical protein